MAAKPAQTGANIGGMGRGAKGEDAPECRLSTVPKNYRLHKRERTMQGARR
jgi:hypothetical protein